MRVLFLSLVFLCTVYGWQYQRPLLEHRLTSFWGHVFARKASIAPALVSRAYLLEQEGEIRFPIPPGAEKLKVISNARLLSSGKNSDKNQALEEVECGYAVDYSLVREEQVLRSGTYHFLSKLSLGPLQILLAWTGIHLGCIQAFMA